MILAKLFLSCLHLDIVVEEQRVHFLTRWAEKGARIFRLTITSIDVIGLQQLATEELALCYI